MKLQGVSIIFILIVVPVVLLLSFYIQAQVDTIALQTFYDTKLLDATYDAMSAFELNTANEDLSSVSDSLRTIIEASNNIFVNTLATNLGMSNASKSYLEPYIPAILYTLYDGYYIYTPTKKPVVLSDSKGVAVVVEEHSSFSGMFSTPGLSYYEGHYNYTEPTAEVLSEIEQGKDDWKYYSDIPSSNSDNIKNDFGQILYKTEDGGYTTDINNGKIKYETEYVLKSYMPYSARYQKGDIDVTINYTLDNYLTIEGTIGDVYYTKSGYLIKDGLVSVDDDSLLDYNENEAEEIIKTGKGVTVTLEDGTKISSNSGENYTELTSELEIAKEQIYSSEKTNNEKQVINNTIKDLTNKIQKMDAVTYYVKSAIFSNWVYKNLGGLQEGNVNQDLVKDYEYVSVNVKEGSNQDTTSAFITDFENKNGEIFSNSTNPEDLKDIFNSHKMDVIRNSIQYNLNLAMSTYNENTTTDFSFSMPVISDEEWANILNNVSIVTFMQGFSCGLKTYNNYAIVSSTNNELTVTPEQIYHIQEGEFNDGESTYHKIDCPNFDAKDTDYISFTSKEVKYDKIEDKDGNGKYDHKNYACYTCSIDGNYDKVNVESLSDKKKKEIYYTGLGALRQELYKMNAIKLSQGFEIIYDKEKNINKPSSRNLNEIKSLEITFGLIGGAGGATATFDNVYGNSYTLNRYQATNQTLTVSVHEDDSKPIEEADISKMFSDPECDIKCIKVIYE